MLLQSTLIKTTSIVPLSSSISADTLPLCCSQSTPDLGSALGTRSLSTPLPPQEGRTCKERWPRRFPLIFPKSSPFLRLRDWNIRVHIHDKVQKSNACKRNRWRTNEVTNTISSTALLQLLSAESNRHVLFFPPVSSYLLKRHWSRSCPTTPHSSQFRFVFGLEDLR